MSLLKQISESIQSYDEFLTSILEKIEQFEEEIVLEKRLGLMETPYYQNGNQQQAPAPSNTVDFQAPTEPVAKPVQHPNAGRGLERIHLIYDPAKGKVVDAMKTDARSRPPSQYVEANAQQVADAMKHITSFSPDVAEKLKNGAMNIWIPRNQTTSAQSDVLGTHDTAGTGGTNKIEMDPSRLAAAHAAAGQMSIAK